MIKKVLYFVLELKNKMQTQDAMEIDVRDEVVAKLKDEGRTFSWMTKKMEMNYNTFYAMFVHKTIRLSDKNRKKINEILGTSF